MIFGEVGYRGFERQFTAGNLKFLDQVGGAGKQDAPAIFDQHKADCGCQMGFTPTRWTKEDEVGAFFEPAITRTQRRHPGAGDHWHYIEGEAVERSEEHTSELQSLMSISYAVFCLRKKTLNKSLIYTPQTTTKKHNITPR